MDEIYLKALDMARKELEGLMQERAHLDSRIAKLAKSIEGLASLSDSTDVSAEVKTKLLELEISEAMGLTEAIRQIIGASMFGITPIQIRDTLVGEGFDPKKYSNMLTVIHNTLLRLDRQREIKRTVTLGGERGWMQA
jgi:hypothetical protein